MKRSFILKMDSSELEKLQKDAALLAKRAAVYSTCIISNNDIINTHHDSEVEREIKAECEMLAQEVINVHSRLESRLETEQPKGTQDSSEVLQTVYKAKERRLRGEIEALESKDIEVVSAHPDFVDALIKKQLSDAVTQLEQTLSRIRTDRKKIDEEMKRERSYLDQQREVQQCLMAEIQRRNQRAEDQETDESDLEDLQEKKKIAITNQRKLMNSLASFVSEYFKFNNKKSEPPEKRSRIRKVKSDASQQPRNESLLQLIEALMNRLFDVPHDPYIELTEKHWPPYVELLLRCGIGQRHPDDHQRLRLTPYHL